MRAPALFTRALFERSSLLRPLPAMIALLSLSIAGCGFFSDDAEDPFDIEITEQVPISFTIDSSDLCLAIPESQRPADCEAEETVETAVEIAAPEPFRFPIPVDIVALTGNQELLEVSTRIKRVEVESVSYTVPENTLNSELEPIEIIIGSHTSSGFPTDSTLLATIPALQAGSPVTAAQTVETSQEGRDASAEFFRDLKMTVVPSTRPVFAKGEPFPPQGMAEVNLVLNLRFVVNPTEL